MSEYYLHLSVHEKILTKNVLSPVLNGEIRTAGCGD